MRIPNCGLLPAAIDAAAGGVSQPVQSYRAAWGTGDRELTALFAGQSAALASDTTAGALVDSVAEATSECLRLFGRC
jgi:hypothetical protein